MSKLPFDAEDDDFLGQLDQEEYYPEETFGDRLRLFYNQFDGSARAILGEALFREAPEASGISHLEILCPNEIIYRRLIQKHQKIANEVRWIWPETMTKVWIGVKRQPSISKIFSLKL